VLHLRKLATMDLRPSTARFRTLSDIATFLASNPT
jgi:hypothetical protein